VPRTSKELRRICKWLRDRISPYDFGWKAPKGPIHCNRNDSILELFRRLRSGLPRSNLARLNNQDFLDHFEGRETFYFTANGRCRCWEVLINFDIDCHRAGSLVGAVAFAEYLRKNHFPGLYYEASTNGKGVHGYILVRKFGVPDTALNRTLKELDRWLKTLLARGRWDVEGVEVKGHAPDLTWGRDKHHLRAYKSGQLAKLPREALTRGDELMGTTKMSTFELDHLSRTTVEVEPVRPPGPEQGPVPTLSSKPKRVQGASRERPTVGSISGLSIPEELAEQVQGRLLGVARDMYPAGITTGKGRAVKREDLATFLAILRFCNQNPNTDGSMPTERVKSLWEGLYRREYTDRGWDHHRYKVLRDWLSKNGFIAWEEEDYIVGREVNGFFQKGQAAKWSASERLLEMLEDQSIVVDDGKFAVDDREFTVVDAEVAVDGAKVTVGDPEVAVDGAKSTVGEAEVDVDGTRVTVDGAEVAVNDTEVALDDAKVTVVDAKSTVVDAEVAVDNANVEEVVVDDAKSTVGEQVLSFSSMDKGEKETSLWAVPHPGIMKTRPSVWQLPCKVPRFAGLVGQTGRLAA